jgi:multicomponent Na+:H+ antiporter subunit E
VIRRFLFMLRYLVIFSRELAKATIAVTKAVLKRDLQIRPGFIAVDMDCESDFEITVFANSITLTPGTISVHVEREQRKIIIHALDVGADPDAVRRDVKDALEANILKWTRRDGWPPRRSS